MVDHCGIIPLSLCGTNYVSWCVDSGPVSPLLVPALTISEESSDSSELSADSDHISLLTLSGSKTSGGLKNTTLSHQPPQRLTLTRRSAFRTSTRTQPNSDSSNKETIMRTAHLGSQKPNLPHHNNDSKDDDDDDDDEELKGNVGPPESELSSQGESSLLHPEKTFLLPRSSPVISRKRKTLSRHGGHTKRGPSLFSPSPITDALTPGEALAVEVSSVAPDTVPGPCHHPSAPQEVKKPCCISVSSNLNRFLAGGLHLPFRGQQQLAEEGSGAESRSRCSSDANARPVPVNKDKRSSDITHCSADIFKTSCELEKENAHFIVVDMVLEVLEGVKWTISLSQRSSVTDAHQQTHCSAADIRAPEHTLRSAGDTTRIHNNVQASEADAHKHAQSSVEDIHTCQQRTAEHTAGPHHGAEETHTDQHKHGQEADTHTQSTQEFLEGELGDRNDKRTGKHTQKSEANAHNCAQCSVVNARKHTRELGNNHETLQPKTLSVLSTDSGFEDCGGGNILISRSSLRNSLRCTVMHSGVERLAQQLVLAFRRSWFPSQVPRGSRRSLRTSLQELPGTHGGMTASSGSRVSLTEEIRQRTRMRGTLYWEPPRFQIISTVQLTHRRSEVVPSQHFLCAGCGTPTEPRYIKKLRYCEYLGRYFCDCCHCGSESVIPGRVLTHWDFSRYPVSDFSKQLLDSVWQQPLFDLTCVGKTLFGRVKDLDKFRELQEQLLGIKRLLTACRLSEGVMSEFDQLPSHLTQQLLVFSMDDLLKLKRGQLVPLARTVLRSATAHVNSCQLCQARGFICEFCRQRDILFPFQSDICKRCTMCKACFHKDCFRDGGCPKCARIQSRKSPLNEASL